MPTLCQATTKAGAPCQQAALPNRLFCLMHDPDSAPLRLDAARKGGAHRSNAARARKAIPEALTPGELAGWLSGLFLRVIEGDAEPKIASAAAALSRAILEASGASELQALRDELDALKAEVNRRAA